ncbi:sensor histidine kinase, partial [Sphingomonas bacterium]|uniref:sensor histidine kinase n=1 Tax=Sphingomonas bacterium TaxID=1895847 RepID=UPI001576FD40
GPATADTLPASFTAGLDRALRRPLARIVANADTINAAADGPIAPDYADYAADIAHAGRHLLELVDDLVDLQAIERPDFMLAVEPIDLAEVARRAAGLLGVRAGQMRVVIERPASLAACPARGDHRRALQIAVNLLGNALRYSPRGETVRVEAFGDRDQARLVVTDRGKGITPADQARIFGKFERVDPSEVGGNGLGLYIARRLARGMNGDLTVESAPGEGARFTLSLPV